MSFHLLAIDEGPDIPIDRDMIVIGRHPQCDARLDSIRISRRHCCMFHDGGELIVRDLGSTNGIRINGQRVEKGRLRVGDELSVAHIRFRLDDGHGQEATVAEPVHQGLVSGQFAEFQADEPVNGHHANGHHAARSPDRRPVSEANPLADAVRELLPFGVADRCRIQVIVQMQPTDDPQLPPPPGLIDPGLGSGVDLDHPNPAESRH